MAKNSLAVTQIQNLTNITTWFSGNKNFSQIGWRSQENYE